MYAEEKLKAEIVKQALEKKVLKPSRWKAMAVRAYTEYPVSISRVCQLFSINETCYRYMPQMCM